MRPIDINARIHDEQEYPGGSDFEAEALVNAMDENGISVALVTDGCYGFGNVGRYWQEGNDHTAAVVSQFPKRLRGVGLINPGGLGIESALDEVERVKEELNFVAIKLAPSAFHHPVDEVTLGRVVSGATSLQLPIIIQTNEGPHATPILVSELAAYHDDGRFVLSHRGYITMFHAFFMMQGRPNVWLDISPLLEWEVEWAAQIFALPGFPVNRVMYGSNFPRARPNALLDALRHTGLPLQALDSILSVNAQELFGLHSDR